MNNKVSRIIKITALVMSVALVIPGCSKSPKKPEVQQQSQQSGQQSEKIPDQLQGIESSIEKILKELNGPSITLKEESKQGSQSSESQQSGQQQESSQDSSGQQKDQSTSEQSGSGGQGSQQGQSGQETQQGQGGQTAQMPPPKDPWQNITPIVNDMHYKWNAFMPLAVKKGANKNLIDNFGNALINLTNAMIGKNKINTLLAANNLYAYVPDFFSLYRTPTSPEIKRIRYYVRNAILSSMTANWAQSDLDVNNLKSSWSLYKNVVSKEQQDDSNKLDFSIYELEKVIKEKNQPLADIKGRVAMFNIEALEKAMEKQSENGGQQEGSQSGNEQSSSNQSSGS